MFIRRMELEDINQLSILYQQFWNELSDINKMREQFSKMEDSETHILLSAIEDNKLVGSVMGIICEELYGECKPFLLVENMIVDKNCRRKGAGKALLTELEKVTKQKNCTQMILVTESERSDACGFYEAYGFQLNNKGYKKKL